MIPRESNVNGEDPFSSQLIHFVIKIATLLLV
jgi:hypothetical protein